MLSRDREFHLFRPYVPRGTYPSTGFHVEPLGPILKKKCDKKEDREVKRTE
jgi:hypothetical protein